MPIALVIVGLIMVITGVKNTHAQFGQALKADFTGPGNFTYWAGSIIIIGSLGYSKTLRPFASSFLVLIFLVFILKNGGVFDKLKEAIDQGPIANPSQPGPDVSGSKAQGGAVAGAKTASAGAGLGADNVAEYAQIAMLVA